MSTGDGVLFKSQNPIQVHSRQENFQLKFCGCERNLVVYWIKHELKENSPQDNSKVTICQLEGYSLADLTFTGSEFDNVVLVTGRNVDTTSQAFLIVLYKIISRAKKTFTVFSHPSDLAEFKSLLMLSDTDVQLDRQRCDENLSSTTFSNHIALEEEDIRQPRSFQWEEKYEIAKLVHQKDPQSTYSKAFVKYLNADVKLLHPLMDFSTNRLTSLFAGFNLDTHEASSNQFTRKIGQFDCNVIPSLPWNRFELLDIVSKLIDNEFSNVAQLIAQNLPKNEDFDKEVFLELRQLTETPYFQCIRDLDPFLGKSVIASYLLNAEEFWHFLKKQAITSQKLLTKIDGSFGIMEFAISKLNPGQFTKFLKSIGVDSLKLSDEQFLDNERNNILMHCVARTTHFCIVAEWVLEQDYLEELLYQENCYGDTCFVLACMYDNFVLVKKLLERYHYDWLRDGFKAIFALCKNGDMLIFKHLLKTLKGENIKTKLDSMRGSKGENILMITTSNTRMMEIFLNFSIEEKFIDTILYEKDALGRSCLFWAVLSQKNESVKMLIERYNYNWRTDRDFKDRTIAHLQCSLEATDVWKFFVANYGYEFIEVNCRDSGSVEAVQIVLNSLNDSFLLAQNFTQLLRCLVVANEGGNGQNKNEILDCLISHMLEKLSLGYDEDEIKQHYLVYALDPEDMLKIGVRILVGPEELEQADSGEPESFSLGSWECIFWAVTERKEIRILTNQPVRKISAILARSEGNCINIFASWEYLGFLMYKIAYQRLPESCTSTCFKSWEGLYEKEFTGLEKHVTRKCCIENSPDKLVPLLVGIDLG